MILDSRWISCGNQFLYLPEDPEYLCAVVSEEIFSARDLCFRRLRRALFEVGVIVQEKDLAPHKRKS